MQFPGFLGPSYQLDNRYAAIEKLSNWYLIPNEVPNEETKYKFVAQPCPVNAAFGTLPVPAPFNQPNRGLLELRGVAYGVNGEVVFSISKTGTYTNIGPVLNDHRPVSMVANGNGQIFIASGGNGYVIPPGGGAGSLFPIPLGGAGFLGASYATFQDGYILVVTPDSNQIQISGTIPVPVGDATQWSALNVSIQAGQADYLRSIISSREYVRLLGHRRSQVYYNAGANGIGGFPFVSYNETFIETGIAAAFSLVDLGDSLVWIGEDARGQRACWFDRAFIPQRISTFAVERFWQEYSTVEDCVAFPFIWMGHLFVQFTFPAANATWLYDVTGSQVAQRALWSERTYCPPNGVLQRRAELFHCFAYGKHLVGSDGSDGNPGAIYQYASGTYTDCGADPISGDQIQATLVLDRICPHLWTGYKRVIINRMEFELARGVGNANNPGKDPLLQLRMSNDGGNVFGQEIDLQIGEQGQYNLRVYQDRLGYAKDWVTWVRCTDPVYNSLINAEIDIIVCAS